MCNHLGDGFFEGVLVKWLNFCIHHDFPEDCGDTLRLLLCSLHEEIIQKCAGDGLDPF